jgi:hypothetical protein
MNEKTPIIVCAANKHNETGLIVCGARHYDNIMRQQMYQLGGFPYWNNCEQGFIDQFGKFYNREEALKLAKENNQIRYRCGGDDKELFSENLY